MRRSLGVGAAVMVLVLAACSGDGDVSADDASSAATSASTTASGASSTTTTSTTPAPAQTPLPSGREAIDAVLAAWEAGDRAAALLVASPDAVDALFAVPVEAREDRGCNSGNVNTAIQCVFRLPSGELQVRARPNVDGSGFLVDFAILGS